MKKLFFILLCAATPAVISAQGFYFRTGLGYAFPSAGQSIDANGTPYSGKLNNATGTYAIDNASFSTGVAGHIGIGYLINRNVGVQLDVNMGISPKKYSTAITNVTLPGGIPGDVTITTRARSPKVIVPSLVLQTDRDLWNLYTRLGIAIPLDTRIILDEIRVNAIGTGAQSVDDFTFEIKNSFSLGFAAAAGVQYKINSRTSLWAEVNMLSMSAYIKQQKLTEVTSNGVSYPLSAVSGTTVINYSKNATLDSTGANQPSYSLPFSSVGISAGIRITLFGNSSNPSRPAGKEGVSERPKPARFRSTK